jgi:hypothetical protein
MKSFALAQRRLELWNERSIVLSKVLPFALKVLRVYAVPNRFTFLSEDCQKTGAPGLETAIIYIKDIGLFVSIPTFNELSLEVQAGLWIHEANRLLQFEAGDYMSEPNLRQATALIMKTNPEELQASQYLEDKLTLGLVLGKKVDEQKNRYFRVKQQICNQFLAELSTVKKFVTEPFMSQMQDSARKCLAPLAMDGVDLVYLSNVVSDAQNNAEKMSRRSSAKVLAALYENLVNEADFAITPDMPDSFSPEKEIIYNEDGMNPRFLFEVRFQRAKRFLLTKADEWPSNDEVKSFIEELRKWKKEFRDYFTR